MNALPDKDAQMKHVYRAMRPLAVSALALALAACALPPRRLDPPRLSDNVPLAGLNVPARAGWPAAEWWKTYHDDQLNRLIAMAMDQAPDLAIAQSRVGSAEQSIRAAAAQAGLSINGNAQIARQRLSEHGLIPARFLGFTWYNQADLGVQLQYDFDWWGKTRAAVESAVDQAHAAQAQRSAAALALQYAVADTYFGWQADQTRLALAQQQLAVQERLTRIAQLRVGQGVDLPDEASRAQAQLAAVREMKIAIDRSGQIRLAALASLVGVAPADLPKLQPRPLPNVSHGLPADAGLDLIARRPDIAASRWQVEAALRQTDVARAQFLPDLSLTALAGLSSIDLGKLFSASSRTFAVTPALHLPLFNSGLLRANYGLSRAQLDGAIAQYRSVVLQAARDVSTQALTAEMLADRREQQQTQIAADQRILRAAQARARQGVRDARESLAAEAQLLQQQDAAAQLQGQAVSADLALIKSLGGGYRMPEAPAPTNSTNSATASSGAHSR